MVLVSVPVSVLVSVLVSAPVIARARWLVLATAPALARVLA
jgi:hypothetical protein